MAGAFILAGGVALSGSLIAPIAQVIYSLLGFIVSIYAMRSRKYVLLLNKVMLLGGGLLALKLCFTLVLENDVKQSLGILLFLISWLWMARKLKSEKISN